MSNKWIKLLESIKNPESGQTLVSEGRILGCTEEGDKLHIKYNREGINTEKKRQLEDEIYQVLEGHLKEENIFIMSVSPESEKKASEPQKAPAGLKIGHGTVGTPKKINNIKKVIAVASGKGGVGKSTFSANLACTLSQQGHKVGIIDADIYGPSIPMIMGVREEKPLASEDKKIQPVEKHGVKIMSFGFFIEENDPVIWRGPMLGGVLNQFFFDVTWGELDYLIIDLPPGTGDVQLSMIQNVSVDGAIIISTPQDVALLDAIKANEMFKKMKLPVLGMVENMAYFICDSCDKKHHIFGEQSMEKGTGQLKETFLGSVPLEMDLRLSSDKGLPYMANKSYEGRQVWKSFIEVANNLTNGNNKKGFLKKLFS